MSTEYNPIDFMPNHFISGRYIQLNYDNQLSHIHSHKLYTKYIYQSLIMII